MRLPLLTTLALLATAPLTAQITQTTAAPAGFVIRVGNDTLVVERFVRTDKTLAGRVAVRGQPEFRYQAHLGANFAVDSMNVEVYSPGAAPDAKPLQEAHLVMRGDSAFVITGGQTHGFKTKMGALPIINNSFALIELFTERARAHGDSADIPGFALNGGITIDGTLRPLAPDSLLLTVAGQPNRLRVDSIGRILGGAVPASRLVLSRVDGSAASKLALGKPDYSAPPGAPYTAREVTLTGPGGITLGGTLTLPNNATAKVPAVVTITGSGQEDRDEYIPIAGGYRPFRQIADTLGRRGIAVLRLDDRMIGASGGKLGTSADYANDIRAGLAWLRQQPEIDGNRLALVGHSEGGLIAPMIAATDPRLGGIVLMAGPSETGRQILAFQQRQAIDHDTAIAAGSRDSLYRVTMEKTDSAARTNAWLGYFMDYNPLTTAAKVKTVPVLILQGGTDHQITPEQAPALEKAFKAAGNKDVTMHLFPGLNHLFIPDSIGLPSDYEKLTDNKVAPQVLGTMADWLAKRLGV